MKEMETAHRRMTLRLEHLWALAALAGVFIFMNLHPIRPNDFWFHLTYGRSLVETGQIPLVDTFSFTMAGQPYESNNNYWLAQTILYLIYKAGGAHWIVLFFSLVVTTAYGILLAVNLQQTGHWRAAALGALFAIGLGVTNWNIRPQLFAYLYAAALIGILRQYRLQNGGWRWGLLAGLVTSLWVNSHGTFFIAFLLAGFIVLEDGWKALTQKNWRVILPGAQLLGWISAGTLLNPRGWRVIEYLLGMFQSSSVRQYVSEWQPASIFRPEHSHFFILFGLFLLAWAVSRHRPTVAEGASFAVFAFLAFQYERGIVWFGITQAGLFALMMHKILLKFQSANKNNTAAAEKPILNAGVALLLATLALASLPWLRSYWPLAPEKKDIYARETPIQAVAAMRELTAPGNIFADIAFSGYISWQTNAEYKVFVDPRFELYPPEIWQMYLDIGKAAPNWQETLDAQNVQILLLSPTDQAALIQAVRLSPHWREVKTDDFAVLFLRNP
jgi:hypothetical protein